MKFAYTWITNYNVQVTFELQMTSELQIAFELWLWNMITNDKFTRQHYYKTTNSQDNKFVRQQYSPDNDAR